MTYKQTKKLCQILESSSMCIMKRYLACSWRRDVRALGGFSSTSERHTAPFPARARSLSAKDIGINTLSSNCSSNTADSQTRDRDTGSRGAGGGTVLVILFDDNAILGDVGEFDVLVGDVADLSSCARDCLDADAVVGVGDGGGLNYHTTDSVVGATADGADG